VVGERLDDHPGAILVERLKYVRRRSHGVAHVVEAVEECHEVISGAGEVLGTGDLERAAAADTRLGRSLAGHLDRGLAVVEAYEDGVWVGLGQYDRRGPVPAADVGDAGSRF